MKDFLVTGGLLLLSLIPSVAGAVRVLELSGDAGITSANARFFAAPVPVVLHLVAAVIFSIGGAVQFAPDFRRRHPRWHRLVGALVVLCGFTVALSALWMNQFFPLGNRQGPQAADFDGHSLYAARLLVGAGMILSLALGLVALRRRNYRGHGDWMIRAYALGLGAGTQVITHLPWFIFPGIRGEVARTVCMIAGWAINLAVAEWIIARPSHRSGGGSTRFASPRSTAATSDSFPVTGRRRTAERPAARVPRACVQGRPGRFPVTRGSAKAIETS